jgi:hypothetical protein
MRRNFDRDFHKVPLFFKLWFAFVFTLIMVIFFSVLFSIYTLVTDPGVVGRMAGEVVSEYNESVK